jgi:hypothetical protein
MSTPAIANHARIKSDDMTNIRNPEKTLIAGIYLTDLTPSANATPTRWTSTPLCPIYSMSAT